MRTSRLTCSSAVCILLRSTRCESWPLHCLKFSLFFVFFSCFESVEANVTIHRNGSRMILVWSPLLTTYHLRTCFNAVKTDLLNSLGLCSSYCALTSRISIVMTMSNLCSIFLRSRAVKNYIQLSVVAVRPSVVFLASRICSSLWVTSVRHWYLVFLQFVSVFSQVL
jgi:hypothetical protein